MRHYYPRIPVERVVPLLDEWRKRYSWEEISRLTDLSTRRLYEIRYVQASVEFNTLDKLLCGMGALHLWQTDFAEYYTVEALQPLGLTVQIAS